MSDIVFKPAHALHELLKAKKLSAIELMGECLSQYAKHNDSLNAVIHTEIDRGRKAAVAADERISKGKMLSMFDGLPMTIKESFDWAGTPSTWGDPQLQDNLPTEDAVALARMTASGAALYGKTNVPYHLSDWQSFNKIYGTTNNPWDVTRTPGGSSGGSAVALATGMSIIDIGSDIGASIRNPAHYCGIYGHKPSYGVVPYRGHLMPGSVSISDITVAGPMARSATDLIHMMDILAQPDDIEARGFSCHLEKRKLRTLKDFRVAVKLSSSVAEVDLAYQDKILDLAQFLQKKTKSLNFEAAPAFTDEEAYSNYILLLRATATKRMTDADYDKHFAAAAKLEGNDKSYVALMTRAFALSHRDWLKLNERRHQMRLLWDQFFNNWDVMICPAAASSAWLHDQVGERHERLIPINGKLVSTIDQRFWAGYSGNFYLPSTVAPIGQDKIGLPCGIQIITRQYGDHTSLRFAELLEQEFKGYEIPLGY